MKSIFALFALLAAACDLFADCPAGYSAQTAGTEAFVKVSGTICPAGYVLVPDSGAGAGVNRAYLPNGGVCDTTKGTCAANSGTCGI